eukprot:3490919-Prymnesium_polylepis.1
MAIKENHLLVTLIPEAESMQPITRRFLANRASLAAGLRDDVEEQLLIGPLLEACNIQRRCWVRAWNRFFSRGLNVAAQPRDGLGLDIRVVEERRRRGVAAALRHGDAPICYNIVMQSLL